MSKSEPILSELYGGRVQVKFHENSHQYWVSVDGSKFARKTGVTTFIGIKDKSRPLQMWQQQITADFLLKLLENGSVITEDAVLEAVIQNDIQKDEAADIGHEIHGWCEAYIKHKLGLPGYDELPDIPNFNEAVTGVNSFLEWEKKNEVKWISSERVVYSIEDDFIGTMDFEAIINGKKCVGDFKSSNGLYNGVRMQTAGYQKAATEEKNTKYKGRWAIRLAKYTEDEHRKRELRKHQIKCAIARFKGCEEPTYTEKPYQVFEAKFLDSQNWFYQRDLQAFYDAKSLRAWDLETDPFYKGADW